MTLSALPLSTLTPPHPPPPSAALSSNFVFLTSHAESLNMRRMKLKEGVSVDGLTSSSSPREVLFFFLPLPLLHWCKSTRLTGCSKSSGSKSSTLLFLSDGGGNGSRGLASARPHHACLSSPLCLPLFPLFSLSLCRPPLPVYCISLHLSPVRFCQHAPSVFPFFSSIFFSLTWHLVVSLTLLPLILLSPHPSVSLPIHFIIYAAFYPPPSTCASISPLPLSFPTEAHTADGYSNRL